MHQSTLVHGKMTQGMNETNLPSVLFKFMDIGINVIPWQFGSFPVAQTRGFPTMLKQ